MITKSYIGVSKEEFYDLFLQLVDVIQKETNKLTKKQRKIMVEFLALDDQVYKFTRFSSLGKKAVAIKLKEKYNWNLSRRNLDIFVINMTTLVKDVIDRLDTQLQREGKRKNYIEIDLNSYAALREELGVSIEQELNIYHGYTIIVNEDATELIRFL